MTYLNDTNGDITDNGNSTYNHDVSGWSKRLVRRLSVKTVYQINNNLNFVGLVGYRNGDHH